MRRNEMPPRLIHDSLKVPIWTKEDGLSEEIFNEAKKFIHEEIDTYFKIWFKYENEDKNTESIKLKCYALQYILSFLPTDY